MIDPATKEAKPADICCADEIRLMKLPRNCSATLMVIIVIIGMNLPVTRIINNVVTMSICHSGTRLKCVTHKIGISDNAAIT